MKTIIIEAGATISEGQEFHVFSDHLKVGDTVEIKRGFHGVIGNPIANGSVVANGSEDPRSKTPHPQGGTERAWKRYWKVRVGGILT